MIKITSLQGEEMFINPDLIERIRSIPDTVLYLRDDKKLPVLDTPKEIIDRIIQYRRAVLGDIFSMRGFSVSRTEYEPEKPEDK